jgi:adenylate kinase family enzyme
MKVGRITIPCKTLDEIVYESDESSVCSNRKRPVEERDIFFNLIIQQDNWIIEDVGRACFSEGLKQADTVVLLEIPLQVRKLRIVLRWIKQRLGIEKSLYKPTFAMLKNMLRILSNQ